MRLAGIWQRAVVGVTCTALLSGCGLTDLRSAMAPTPSQVADYVKELRAGSELIKDMTPREYLTASIVYSNQKCREFFNAITEGQRDSQMINKVLNLAMAAGTSLYPVYAASQRSQAVFTAILTGGIAANDAVREIYTFGPYANELANKVTEAQNVFLGAQSTRVSISIVSEFSSRELTQKLQVNASGHEYTPLPSLDFVIKLDHVTKDEALLLARYIAQGYAYQCSVANISSLIRSSITSARIENVATPQSGSMSQAVPVPVQQPARSNLGNPVNTGGGSGKPVKPQAPVVANNNAGSGSAPKPQPPQTTTPRILGAISTLEKDIEFADGVRIQQALCVPQADGDFGAASSPTREAIGQFQATKRLSVSGLLTDPQDKAFLLKLGRCEAPYATIYERLTLDVAGKIKNFHADLRKAMKVLKSPPPASSDLWSDDFANQTQITKRTRDAIVFIQHDESKPETGALTVAVHDSIRNKATAAGLLP
jgi:hypothetical protein